MKTRLICTVLCLQAIFAAMPALGQNRFDILFDGPWMFYVESNFNNKGTSVLIAIAPDAASSGHDDPLFTTGDGAPIGRSGFHCVAFASVRTSGDCTPDFSSNTTATIGHGPYPEPNLVQRNKPPNWDWVAYSAVSPVPYVLILPMPNSWSADGEYKLAFGDAFPSATPPAKNPYNLGVLLHYDLPNAPAYLNLASCTPNRATPGDITSVATCAKAGGTFSQENTGTLRITMQTHPDSALPALYQNCSFHDHLAYHMMLSLLDPALSGSGNKDVAFVGVDQSNRDCLACDPQIKHCRGVTFAHFHSSKLAPQATSDALKRLLPDLEVCKQEQKDKDKDVDLILSPSLTSLASSGEISRKSELESLIAALNRSMNAINRLSKTRKTRSCNAALHQEQDLIKTAKKKLIRVSGLDGIDCRASIILIN